MTSRSIYKTPAGERLVMAHYDAMLARWPVPYEMVYVPTRHGEAFALASGDKAAPPLVLLHGAGTNSIMWSGDIARYSRRYRTYAIDLPGEPGKSAPNLLDWDGPAFSEWLQDVLDGLEIERARLVGFSQGGWTALKFSAAQPERVEKLVLLSPGGIVPDKLSFVVQALPYAMLGPWGIRRLSRLLSGDQAVSAEAEEALILLMTHFKPRVASLPIFTDQQLQRLTMPVLVMMGDRDALRDAHKIITRLQKQVPCLDAAVIPGGGHALINTVEEILVFLSGEA